MELLKPDLQVEWAPFRWEDAHVSIPLRVQIRSHTPGRVIPEGRAGLCARAGAGCVWRGQSALSRPRRAHADRLSVPPAGSASTTQICAPWWEHRSPGSALRTPSVYPRRPAQEAGPRARRRATGWSRRSWQPHGSTCCSVGARPPEKAERGADLCSARRLAGQGRGCQEAREQSRRSGAERALPGSPSAQRMRSVGARPEVGALGRRSPRTPLSTAPLSVRPPWTPSIPKPRQPIRRLGRPQAQRDTTTTTRRHHRRSTWGGTYKASRLTPVS
ncbi:uncharacterized protein LOC124903406 [Homo sapiens]|uniref:uncharacterized protein LOC124903406 n=1 Tax=Homo sapiens TaxID=9606 RepID=UPI000387DD5A|nr:uncharacterized protein LOC124903406 [Homo sapiens]XP_047302323.1 uncharacterized protein LOC124903406 [Homo sapiens]